MSELVGLDEWSYVWACGVVTPLQPSDDATENDAWEEGVRQLRRAIKSLGRTHDPALPSYGIVRVDVLTLGGAALRMS